MPQSIMFVLPHMRAGGIEIVVRELANSLSRDRWQPVLCLASAKGDLLGAVSPDVRILDNGGRRAASMIFRLPQIIRQERPDLVYVGTNAMNIAVLAAFHLIPRKIRPKLIVSEHTSADLYLKNARYPFFRKALMRALYPAADVLAAPMEVLAREWVEMIGVKNLPVVELPNPIISQSDVDRIQATGLQRRQRRIVTAGRLIQDKGHDVLVHAMVAIQAQYPDATLDIFGVGEEEQNLRDLIENHRLGDVVRLRGYTANLLEEFAQADIVAVPSRREGFGNVVVEALAMGARVVASDCPGPRAILSAGELGALVPIGDVSAMAGKIMEIFDGKSEHRSGGVAVTSLQRYFKENAVAEFDRVAQSVIDG